MLARSRAPQMFLATAAVQIGGLFGISIFHLLVLAGVRRKFRGKGAMGEKIAAAASAKLAFPKFEIVQLNIMCESVLQVSVIVLVMPTTRIYFKLAAVVIVLSILGFYIRIAIRIHRMVKEGKLSFNKHDMKGAIKEQIHQTKKLGSNLRRQFSEKQDLVHMKKMQKLHVVIAVQAMCRGYLARARARIMLRSTIRTQALVRGYVVRQRMRRARLLGMTYDQFLEHEGYQAGGSESAETPASRFAGGDLLGYGSAFSPDKKPGAEEANALSPAFTGISSPQPATPPPSPPDGTVVVREQRGESTTGHGMTTTTTTRAVTRVRETTTERVITTVRETETLLETTTTTAPSRPGDGGAGSARIEEVAPQGSNPSTLWAGTNRSQGMLSDRTSVSPATTQRSFGGWLNALTSDPDYFAEPAYFTVPAPKLPEPMKNLPEPLAPIQEEPKEVKPKLSLRHSKREDLPKPVLGRGRLKDVVFVEPHARTHGERLDSFRVRAVTTAVTLEETKAQLV